MGLTDKDKKLIEKALKLKAIDWSYAGVYAKEADSPEAKEQLRKIESTLYHKEEYLCDNL